MKVNIVTVTGQCSEVFINVSQTVEDLKLKIAQSQNLSFDQIKLLWDRKPLTDGKLTSHGIGDNSTINMVIGERVTIKVSLKLPDGKLDSREFEPSEQIANVKQMIQMAYGYKVEQIELIFEGRTLQGGQLTHHRIQNGSILVIKLKKIRITVSDMDGKKFDVEIEHHETVDGLKQRLHTKTGVMESQQRLLCLGQELSSGPLTRYGICNGSVINMVGRLRGG